MMFLSAWSGHLADFGELDWRELENFHQAAAAMRHDESRKSLISPSWAINSSCNADSFLVYVSSTGALGFFIVLHSTRPCRARIENARGSKPQPFSPISLSDGLDSMNESNSSKSRTARSKYLLRWIVVVVIVLWWRKPCKRSRGCIELQQCWWSDRRTRIFREMLFQPPCEWKWGDNYCTYPPGLVFEQFVRCRLS